MNLLVLSSSALVIMIGLFAFLYRDWAKLGERAAFWRKETERAMDELSRQRNYKAEIEGFHQALQKRARGMIGRISRIENFEEVFERVTIGLKFVLVESETLRISEARAKADRQEIETLRAALKTNEDAFLARGREITALKSARDLMQHERDQAINLAEAYKLAWKERDDAAKELNARTRERDQAEGMRTAANAKLEILARDLVVACQRAESLEAERNATNARLEILAADLATAEERVSQAQQRGDSLEAEALQTAETARGFQSQFMAASKERDEAEGRADENAKAADMAAAEVFQLRAQVKDLAALKIVRDSRLDAIARRIPDLAKVESNNSFAKRFRVVEIKIAPAKPTKPTKLRVPAYAKGKKGGRK